MKQRVSPVPADTLGNLSGQYTMGPLRLDCVAAAIARIWQPVAENLSVVKMGLSPGSWRETMRVSNSSDSTERNFSYERT